jgi:alpha-glucosidase
MNAADPSSRPDPAWWRTAVIYQVFPRSFADSNADGIGDLRGAASKLAYLSQLGVDAIWLSPFYPSPLADAGYDLTDHRDVDPRLGTLDDFDDLVARAHRLRLRVIIDIVPNHTSDQHPWFREALAAPIGHPARDRYHFHDGGGAGGDGPPSDWRSHFGGSAWERVRDGQWYLHLFAREQPDLNWDNPEVRRYFLDTLRFWADRGVDGFRVDVAHALAKDMSEPLRSQPHLDARLPLDGTDPLYDRDEVHEIYQTWRAVFDEYDPPRMAVAETWTPTTDRTYLYARPTELGQVFDFSLLKSPWDRDTLRAVITRSLHDHRQHADDGGGLTWVLSSHDIPRHASRLALPKDVDPNAWLITRGTEPTIDPELGRRRARAATLMMLALPGSAYLYQGEELGLLEVADLPDDALHDPIWNRSAQTLRGRDGCRVPIPWVRDKPSFGFGDGGTWLPQPPWYARFTADRQESDPHSSLRLYREALRLRRILQPPDSALEWLTPGDPDVLHFRRDRGWECLTNLGAAHKPLPPGTPLLASGPLDGPVLPPDTTVWLTPAPDGRRA